MKKLLNTTRRRRPVFKFDLKMKLSILLLLVTFFSLKANDSYAQRTKITLNLHNITVGQLIDEIERSTEFQFVYKIEDVDLARIVSVNADNERIDDILNQVFGNTRTTFNLNDRRIYLVRRTGTPISHPPKVEMALPVIQYSINGTIKDQDGNPLPGANVVEKGTTNGVTADFDGNFSIEVADDNAVLLVSYIGFGTKEVMIDGQRSIDIVLEEAAAGLDEVVVVGYGTVKKGDVTGAVSTVSEEDITALPTTDVQQALKGRSAGVRVVQSSGQPGSSVQIQIRGGNSYLGDNNPLYVVDGFPITGSIDFLNPSDIQTIDILKDASATAIYGSRGANGVVMITTKGGKKGEQGRVDFQSYYGMQEVLGTYDLMNSSQFAAYANERAVAAGDALPFDLNNLPNIDTDWQDVIFRTAPIQSHTLTFSGGNERSSYSLSANYFDQQGTILNSSQQRGSVRLSLNQKVNDWLKVDGNAVVTRSENRDANVNNGAGGGNNIFSAALGAQPMVAPYDANGEYSDLGAAYPFSTTMNNPLAYAEILDQRLSTKVLTNLSAEFQLTGNLKFKILGGTEQEFAENNYYSPSLIANRTPTGSASTGIRRNISYLNENILSFDKNIFEDHSLSAIAGFTMQTFQGRFNQSSATGFASDNLQNNAIGSGQTTLPNQSSISEWTLLSWLGRVNYSINDKYLFTGSIRADGSSRFGKNNKWGVFTSGAFAWKLKNENFLKDWDALSDLKLRVGYGETGSTAINPYQSLNSFGQTRATFGNSDVIGFANVSAPNPDLKWETTAQLGIGTDVSFYNNRLRFTVDYYRKNTKDLLAIIPLPGSSGFGSLITNLGEVENSGMEFSLGATISEGAFGWDMNGQLSFNRNKVITIGADILGAPLDIPFAAPVNIAREGEPLGMFYGFLEEGIDDQGVITYRDLNGDGEISNEDQQILGNPYPDFIYGLNNNFSYGNFELNLFIEGSQGNDLFWATGGAVAVSLSTDTNQLADLANNSWTPGNTDALYPRATFNRAQFRVSDRFIKDGSYLRLKNIKLGYNLPVRNMDIGIKALQLYISGQNLITISNYPGIDPEVNTRSATGDLRIGIDQTGYPSSKIYTLGLNIQL